MRKEEIMYGAEPYSGDKGERSFYVRRGKTDGWQDEMSEGVARMIEKVIEKEFSKVMAQVGYL